MLQNYEEGHYTKVRFESGIIFRQVMPVSKFICHVMFKNTLFEFCFLLGLWSLHLRVFASVPYRSLGWWKGRGRRWSCPAWPGSGRTTGKCVGRSDMDFRDLLKSEVWTGVSYHHNPIWLVSISILWCFSWLVAVSSAPPPAPWPASWFWIWWKSFPWFWYQGLSV